MQLLNHQVSPLSLWGRGTKRSGGGSWGAWEEESLVMFLLTLLSWMGRKPEMPSFRVQMLEEERRKSFISIMHCGLWGSSTQIIILFLYDMNFFIFTYLWLTPRIILVGDQRGSWAVRITPRRNWFGFCTSGWAEVSVWLRVYSWSQATRRIWNYIFSGKGSTSTNTYRLLKKLFSSKVHLWRML